MKVMFLIAACVFGFGCGIKGPPLPPIETIEDHTANGAAKKSKTTPTTQTSGDKTVAPKTK